MSSEPPTEDVFAKMDALLKRHQQGALQASRPAPAEEPPLPPIFDDITPPAELAAVAERRPEPVEAIPTLTEVIEEPAIPLLTEVVGTGTEGPEQGGILHRLEQQLVQQLEDRIASQLTVAFDQALADLLESSRTSIEQAVRETLAHELGRQLDTLPQSKPADKP